MIGWGIFVGVFTGLGLWLALTNHPGAARMSLVERLTPYLRPGLSGAGAGPRTGAGFTPRWGAVGRLAWPMLVRLSRGVDKVMGGARSVNRRLASIGSERRLEDFRLEQVMWGVVGALGGAALTAAIAAATLSVNVLAAIALVAVGAVTGVLGRDWWLTVQVRNRERAMLAEFPVVAEFLALAVTAGEAPTAALERVCRMCKGELSRELAQALAEARAGTPLTSALQAIAERTNLDVLSRFIDGLVIALERGTPLAEVLRAQAADVREAEKRALLATGGRREIAMMFPVVFLILPITVLFAMYPGLVNITLLTK